MNLPLPNQPLRLLALAALAILSSSANAQSLKALVDTARDYDASYLSAKALAESAKYRAAQSDALNLPSAKLTGGATAARVTPPSNTNLSNNNQQASLGASYALFNRSNSVTVSQAAKALEVSRADLALAEQDLIVRISQAYFDVLGAQDTLTTAQANKKAIAEQLASAKRNFEVGTATITDTREAQARYDLATAQEILADNDLLSKHIALDQAVGQSGVAPRPLAQPVVLPNLAADTVESWVGKSDSAPSVGKARLALDVAKLEIDKARAGNLPTLDAVGSYSVSHSTGSAITASGNREGNTRTASVGLQFAMPLYTGGAADNRIKETLKLEEKSRNDLEAARRSVAQSTRQIYFGVQSGTAQVKALEAAESSSKLALEATQLGYKVGVRVNLDVLNAQTQLFTTQRDLAKARYDVLLNSLKLRQAAGTLADPDLDTVNRLLR
jgi:outer membrane protein